MLIPARLVPDFFLTPPDEHGVRQLSLICPCGACGALAGINVGPQQSGAPPVWTWNGNEDKPTCGAAVLVRGAWYWIIAAGPRRDTYVCEQAHTDSRVTFHWDEFEEVI